MRVGLVLGAGGSVGVAYHGAVLATIEEETGWDPRQAEVVVGTSAGSISASMLRAGVPAGDLARISEGQPLSPEGRILAERGRPRRPRPRAGHLLGFRPLAAPEGVLHAVTHPLTHPLGALVAAVLPAGGIPTEAISDGIDEMFGGSWPSRHLWVNAVDIRTGGRVVFGRPGAPRAPVGAAVAASSAIPGYFRPVSIEGRRYVDGAVRSMVNLDLLAGLGLDLVVVSSPMSAALPGGGPSPSTLVRRGLGIRLRAEADALRRSGVAVAVVEPDAPVTVAMGLNPMDARRRGEVSRAARVAVRSWLRSRSEGRWLAAALGRAAEPAAEAGLGVGVSSGSAGSRRPSA